jgi:membrane protease YdiL (CAAX protease family)
MNNKQIIAIIAPPILIAIMYPIFQSLAGFIENDRIAWYLGLATYWFVWGIFFPIIMIGTINIKKLIRPRRLSKKILMLLAIPIIGAVAAKLVPGMGGYEKESVLLAILIISTPFGNGFFEEVLWRGVFVKLFPENIFFRMIWPSIWFGIWHYVPVSMNNPELTGLIGMMVGPLLMGLYLSYLTYKTNTLWWAIVTHTVGGIIMIA